MLWFARLVGLIVGVIVDEALFPNSEWTSAIVPIVFAIFGWVVAAYLARRLGRRSEVA